MADHTVTIYSAPWCPYCKQAKSYLKDHGVAFMDVDIEKDPTAGEMIVKKSGQMGIPVIEVDGKRIIVGFDRPALREVLGLKD